MFFQNSLRKAVAKLDGSNVNEIDKRDLLEMCETSHHLRDNTKVRTSLG